MVDKFESKEHKQLAEGLAAIGLVAGFMVGIFTTHSPGGWVLVTVLGGLAGSAVAMAVTKIRR